MTKNNFKNNLLLNKMERAMRFRAGEALSWPPVTLSEIDKQYKCPICKQIFVNVHQADDCGCRYCFDCLDDVVRSTTECPVCKYRFASQMKIPDRYFARKVSNQIVKCVHPSCQWQGTLLDYRRHYNTHFMPTLINRPNA